MINLHLLYYKKYFEKIDYQVLLNKNTQQANNENNIIKQCNKALLTAPLYPIPANPLVKENAFSLKTIYPGLVTGVGIGHEIGVKGEFKLGMHFDYTYGMPIIYGSSVKGVLRAAFPEKEKEKKEESKKKIAEKKEKEKQIRQFLGSEFEGINVAALRDAIFEGIKEQKPISIYERDIFFDAVITRCNKKSRFLASDSITPHDDNPLKDPIPLTFLKIASGVTIEFRFDLKDSVICGIKVSAEDKLRLFEKILLEFGIGAKTNVGYGQFEK